MSRPATLCEVAHCLVDCHYSYYHHHHRGVVGRSHRKADHAEGTLSHFCDPSAATHHAARCISCGADPWPAETGTAIKSDGRTCCWGGKGRSVLSTMCRWESVKTKTFIISPQKISSSSGVNKGKLQLQAMTARGVCLHNQCQKNVLLFIEMMNLKCIFNYFALRIMQC